ncbi:MAG: VPS10 domain-containing protein [Phycisphaerales bacterium]
MKTRRLLAWVCALVTMPVMAADPPALDPAWIEQMPWRSIGPANMGGRITDLAVVPGDPATYYAATASGGLLKTVNNGMTFEHLFDREATVSIGSMAVAASDANIVWVGTGEANPRNSVSWGDGVYKSVDGGKTWKNMGLRDSFQIGAVVIHPTNPDVVLVGAMGRCWGTGGSRGLFKTTDGGETWKRVLETDDKTGVIDIAISPGDPNIILAATWERQRDGFDSNDPIKRWGPGSGLWKSSDGGETWKRLSSGLPEVQIGRIGIEFYQKDPKVAFIVIETEKSGAAQENAAFAGLTGEDAEAGARVTRVVNGGPAAGAELKAGDIILSLDGKPILSYAGFQAALRERAPDDEIKVVLARERKPVEATIKLGKRPGSPDDRPYGTRLGGQVANIQNEQGVSGFQTGGVFRSDDAGDTWRRINSLTPRPMYFSKIRIDPTDEKVIYVLGVSLHISRDGGATFTEDYARQVHADHHAMWINPANPKHALVGCDGGVYVTYDQGKNWDHLNRAAIGQFYHVAVDARPFYNVYGGLQDNGSWGGPARSRTGGAVNEDWFRVGSGDGFLCAVDPNDADQVYYESQNGATGWRNLRTGRGGSLRPPPAPDGARYRFNWETPFLLSAHNSKIYYSAGNYVFRTLTAERAMKRISPEISRTDKGSATALTESPLDADVLYVGTDDGALWATRDGGKTWVDLFNPPAPSESEQTPQRPRGGGAAMLARMDENGDGKLQRSETPEQMGRMFDDADANQDGVLDAEEMTAMAGRFGGGGRGGFGGRGGGGRGGDEAAETPNDEPPAEAPDGRPTAAPPRTGGANGGERAGEGATRQPEPAANPVAGTWNAKATGAELPTEIAFDLILTLEAEGKVGGRIRSDLYSGPLNAGTFDASAGKIRIGFEGPMGPVTIEANVSGDKITGTMGGQGGFSVPFEGTRMREQTQASGRPGRRSARQPAAEPGKALKELVPEPRWVASLEASRFVAGRVYMALDGHRSNEDGPMLLASEDYGRTWRSITTNLPANGSTRVLREDIAREDVLYTGTEFGCFVSIDRGKSWTKMNGNLPTVAVHDFAQHPTTGEIVAATHGRSLWVFDATALRQMTTEAIAQTATLYKPATAHVWRSEPSRGISGSRHFIAQGGAAGATIYYSLATPARELTLRVTTQAGVAVRELREPSMKAGLNRVVWDLRRDPPARPAGGTPGAGTPGGPGGAPGGAASGATGAPGAVPVGAPGAATTGNPVVAGAPGAGGPGGRGFGGQRVATGVYRVVLVVDGKEYTQDVTIAADPDFPESGLAVGEEEWTDRSHIDESEEEEAARPIR